MIIMKLLPEHYIQTVDDVQLIQEVSTIEQSIHWFKLFANWVVSHYPIHYVLFKLTK